MKKLLLLTLCIISLPVFASPGTQVSILLMDKTSVECAIAINDCSYVTCLKNLNDLRGVVYPYTNIYSVSPVGDLR